MLSIHPHTVLLPTKHQHNFDDFCEEIRIVVPLEKLMFSQKLAPTSDIKACLPANRSINAQPFFSIIYPLVSIVQNSFVFPPLRTHTRRRHSAHTALCARVSGSCAQAAQSA